MRKRIDHWCSIVPEKSEPSGPPFSGKLCKHHFFMAHIFWQKCWNRTFSMIIYSLTLNLCLMTSKNIGITHVIHSATSKAILAKCPWNLNVYIFYLCFALGIIHVDCCVRKTPKQLFYSSKTPLFGSLNLVTPLLFEERLVLTSY